MFSGTLGKEGISTEQITEINIFVTQNDMNVNINLILIF